MELGGNAPFIVFDDADLDTAVAGAMASKFRNAGQTCVCANRILVQDGVYDAFAEKLAAAVARPEGRPRHRSRRHESGPLINADAVKKVSEHVADAVEQGRRRRHRRQAACARRHLLRADAAHRRHAATCAIAREETFGPVAPLFRSTTEAEAIAHGQRHPVRPRRLLLHARRRPLLARRRRRWSIGIVGVNEGIIFNRGRSVRRGQRESASAARARTTASMSSSRSSTH